jgi:prepilin-type N-terminal cleavage/methylation domain-containing protein
MHRFDDRGFTLVEALVSIMVIGVVMVALTAFFVNTTSITNRQRGQQTAIQLADDAIEQVRALKGAALPTGRTGTGTDAQWSTAGADVLPYLTGMRKATDPAPSGDPVLPFNAEQVINGVAYTQHWYLGTCWQAPAGGDCAGTQLTGYVELFRVVVAVTWPDRRCAGSHCTYVTSTLVSGAESEPVFNSNDTAQPPAVNSPGTQVGELTVAVSLQLTAAGGAAPLTWAATGLPPGLQLDSSGLITGTPTAVGTYTVTATATDSFSLTGTATFTWTVNALPQLTGPGAQASTVSRPVTLPVAVTGGTAPLKWTATGLPVGLTISETTGSITGTPTTATAGPVSVTVTATDAFNKAATTTFTWQVNAVPAITSPGDRTDSRGATISLQVAITGGTAPYTWNASNLPTGLTISGGGLVSGTIGNPKTSYAVTITATDSRGATATTTFTWTVQ